MTLLPPRGEIFGMGQFDAQSTGLEFLGQTSMPIAATASAALDVAPRDFLLIAVLCTGLSATGQPAIRFGASPGAAVDSGANYFARNMMSATNGAITPGNFGNDPRSDANRMILGYSRTDGLQADISELGGTTHRVALISVQNLPGTKPTCQWFDAVGTGAAATVGRIWSGWGQWNSTVPIRRLQIVSMDDVATMSAGSGITVWGATLP